MQSVLQSSGRCTLGRPAAGQRRPQRVSRLACRADGSLNTPSSLIGCHSQVWVGGWDKKDITKSVEGTKNAGFDLIEGIAAPSSQSSLIRRDPFTRLKITARSFAHSVPTYQTTIYEHSIRSKRVGIA